MKLLKQLYRINSPSGKEGAMQDFIIRWLDEHEIKYVKDGKGNILAAKDTRQDKTDDEECPCVCAHMDEVHIKHESDYIVHQDGDVIYGFSATAGGQQGIGGDDKNGIWVALKVLERVPYTKAAFFVGEESGCIGSSYVDLGFFDNCRFVIQCDRKNGGDFIHHASSVPLCTDEFMEAMHASEYGYKKAYGLMTDVMELRRRGLKCCACNLSCGYYNPHTDREITRISELRNCYNMVLRACMTIKDRFDAPIYTPPKVSYANWGTSTYRAGDYDWSARGYSNYSHCNYGNYDNYSMVVNNPKNGSEVSLYEEDDYTDSLYMYAEGWAITDALETAIIKQAKPTLIEVIRNAKESLDKAYPPATGKSVNRMYDSLSYAVTAGWISEFQLEDILSVVDEDWIRYKDEYDMYAYSDMGWI